VLCGIRNVAQLRDNLGAARIKLDPADLARMRRDVVALGEPARL